MEIVAFTDRSFPVQVNKKVSSRACFEVFIRDGGPNSVSTNTAVSFHKGWGEFRTVRSQEVGCGILSFDIFDVDVHLSDFLIVGVSGYFGKGWSGSAAGVTLPSNGEPHSIFIAANVNLAEGVSIALEPFFKAKAVSNSGVYGGPEDPESIAQWRYCSAGFWIGSDVASRLNAIYLESSPHC